MASPDTLTALAPAKINLSLILRGRRPDGYHLIDSRVAFAGLGDLVSLGPDAPSGLTLSGPFAAGLAADPDNLVLKAARLFAEAFPGARGGAFHLVKRLPLASGIGGGSADGAAALRLLARLNGVRRDDPRLGEVALRMGADGPVCLRARGCVMGGIGEVLGPPLPALRLPAVLLNPGVHVPTPAVFAALGLTPDTMIADGPPAEPWPQARNDLQAAAIGLAPAIGEALALLSVTDGVQHVRMSGSGATCFATYPDRAQARAAARDLRRKTPHWWICDTILR